MKAFLYKFFHTSFFTPAFSQAACSVRLTGNFSGPVTCSVVVLFQFGFSSSESHLL
jgi:hypothetical protein